MSILLLIKLGWGYTADRGSQSSVLMKVNLKVIPTKECYQNHPIDIGSPKAKNVICTYRDNKDSCDVCIYNHIHYS